jgi:hypothetical protein
MKHTATTCAHLLPLLPQWTLVDAEFDAGTDEVAQVDKQIDRGRGGRREAGGARDTREGPRREAWTRVHGATRETQGWAGRSVRKGVKVSLSLFETLAKLPSPGSNVAWPQLRGSSRHPNTST